MNHLSLRERLQHTPRWLWDAVLAVAQGSIVLLSISFSSPEPGGRPADAFAYALASVPALLLLVRRRRPLGVLLASALVMVVYHALNYPPTGYAVPLGVATFTAAAAGHVGISLMVVLFVEGGGLLYRLVVEATSVRGLVRTGTLLEVAVFAAVIFLGDAFASRRALTSELRDKLRRAEKEREQDARRRVTEERMRIARELHDVMAHTVSVIAVQAGVAADVIDESPEDARGAIEAIRAASREAMTELKATVGVLREGAATPLSPAPGLEQLDALVDLARGAGLDVDVSVAGEERSLPGAVQLTAYRVLQESLTNVVRHARATSVAVAIRYGEGEVILEIVDDGTAPAGRGGTGDGYGIAGMRERARALGGRLEAGPGPNGGFRVTATLPTDDRR